MTAIGCEVSFGGGVIENILKLMMVMAAQLWIY